MGAVLAARLPGFGLQQFTNATPGAAFLMYAWPGLWIAGLMFLLSFPGFEMLKRGRMAPMPVASAAQ